jgi:acetamidase/formamidase
VHHWLRATPENVKLGVVDRSDATVLSVDSGDEVSFETWSGWGNSIGPETTLDDVMRGAATLAEAGPHDLTGPVEVRGASAGDVLRVDVLELRPRTHATNVTIPGVAGVGLLPDLFPEGAFRHFELDPDGMTVALAPGLTVPIAPFLGFLAVAPEAEGPHNSIPPGSHGGNIDLKDLTVGSTLYLPVWKDGASFYVGDGHARQGNGEVNVTALETTFEEARVRLTIVEGRSLELPRAETPSSWITLGFGDDLLEAARAATRGMIDLLGELAGVEPAEAYALCSMCVDLEITQAVNTVVGVHARLRKELLA